MQLKSSNQLRIRALLGMGFFIVIVILNGFYQHHTHVLMAQNHRLLGELQLLEAGADSFFRSSRNYQQNAARDYESYYRDITVFLRDLNADIEAFSLRMASLENQFKGLGFALPILTELTNQRRNIARLDSAITEAQDEWARFRQGYEEKLGDDKKEPRIEWGTDFIVANHPQLEQVIKHMTGEYSRFLANQTAISEAVLQFSEIGILVLGFLILSWFYFRVLRRIGKAANACVRLANGDFGHTLAVDGSDELGVLAKAFNLVSSRSQLVMAMQNQLYQVQTLDQALTVISQTAGGFLPIAWVGIMHVDAQKQLKLLSALPPQSSETIVAKAIAMDRGLGKQLANSILSKKPFIQSGLITYALDNERELFIRDLVKAYEIESIMAIPMVSRRGWEGVIIFGTRKGEYNQGQTELLGNLSTMMAEHFQRLSGDGTQLGVGHSR